LDSIFSGEKCLGGLQYEQSFGESLFGDHLETSPYQISFLESVDWRLLCKKTTLYKNQLEKFKEVIHNNYFFEMFVEDLPVRGYIGDATDEAFLIGEVKGSKTFLFPHLHFYLGYNGDQIVAAKVTTDVRERYLVCSLEKNCRWYTHTTNLNFSPITDGPSGRYH
jgi:hypothetical protein